MGSQRGRWVVLLDGLSTLVESVFPKRDVWMTAVVKVVKEPDEENGRTMRGWG